MRGRLPQRRKEGLPPRHDGPCHARREVAGARRRGHALKGWHEGRHGDCFGAAKAALSLLLLLLSLLC